MRMAWAIKGTPLTASTFPAAGTFLTRGALTRARDTAELLALRGYRRGGTLCPRFRTAGSDLIASGAAVAIGALVIISW